LPAYEQALVWFDNPDKGQQLASGLAEQGLFRKEKIRTFAHELDANELLVSGELGDVVRAV